MNEGRVAQAWQVLSTWDSEDTIQENRAEQWNKAQWIITVFFYLLWRFLHLFIFYLFFRPTVVSQRSVCDLPDNVIVFLLCVCFLKEIGKSDRCCTHHCRKLTGCARGKVWFLNCVDLCCRSVKQRGSAVNARCYFCLFFSQVIKL